MKKLATGAAFLAGLAVLAVVMLPTVAFGGQDELAPVREVTAKFHRVEAALEAGMSWAT